MWDLTAALKKASSLNLSLLTCVMGIKSTALSKKMKEKCFEKNQVTVLSVSLQQMSTRLAVGGRGSEHTVSPARGRAGPGLQPRPSENSHTEAPRTIPGSASTPFALSHTQLRTRKGRAPRAGDRSEGLC